MNRVSLIGKNGLYDIYPKVYVQRLKQEGLRKKAMAFLDYWDDYQNDDVQSFRFYEKAWGKGKSTAERWVKDFKETMENFEASWWLENSRMDKSAKKSVGHERDTSSTREHQTNTHEQTNHTNDAGQQRDSSGTKIKTPLGVDVIGMHTDKNFKELFMIYSANGGKTGKKNEAYEEYKKVACEFDIKDVIRAIPFYLHDISSHMGRTFNCANFLNNNAFLPYMPKRVLILIKDEWIAGVIDDKTDRFLSDKEHGGKRIGAEIDSKKMVSLFGDGRLKFMTETKR